MGFSLLGTAIGSDDYLQNFFQTKLQKIDRLLAKVTRINSTHCKYHMVRFSVNAKLRHLLRSLPVSRCPVKDFYVQFNQTILNFMFRELNIPSPSDTMLLQASLGLSHGGLGLLFNLKPQRIPGLAEELTVGIRLSQLHQHWTTWHTQCMVVWTTCKALLGPAPSTSRPNVQSRGQYTVDTRLIHSPATSAYPTKASTTTICSLLFESVLSTTSEGPHKTAVCSWTKCISLSQCSSWITWMLNVKQRIRIITQDQT